MSVPMYEVFAIRVGANAQRTARENFLYDACCGDPNAPMPLDYYFWVIRNEHQVIVVDTCFQPATADRRNRQMYRLPEDSLRQLDIDPAQVEHLILTHLALGSRRQPGAVSQGHGAFAGSGIAFLHRAEDEPSHGEQDL